MQKLNLALSKNKTKLSRCLETKIIKIKSSEGMNCVKTNQI